MWSRNITCNTTTVTCIPRSRKVPADSETGIIPYKAVNIRFITLYGIITEHCPPNFRGRLLKAVFVSFTCGEAARLANIMAGF